MSAYEPKHHSVLLPVQEKATLCNNWQNEIAFNWVVRVTIAYKLPDKFTKGCETSRTGLLQMKSNYNQGFIIFFSLFKHWNLTVLKQNWTDCLWINGPFTTKRIYPRPHETLPPKIQYKIWCPCSFFDEKNYHISKYWKQFNVHCPWRGIIHNWPKIQLGTYLDFHLKYKNITSKIFTLTELNKKSELIV